MSEPLLTLGLTPRSVTVPILTEHGFFTKMPLQQNSDIDHSGSDTALNIILKCHCLFRKIQSGLFPTTMSQP